MSLFSRLSLLAMHSREQQQTAKRLIDTKNATKSFARANGNIQPLSLLVSGTPPATNLRKKKKEQPPVNPLVFLGSDLARTRARKKKKGREARPFFLLLS